ncbi:DUF3800 domain-containing protein [Bradyrhizobium sp.]|uniref:DUF3800 domain-containing protein n=1 Tax=Bradyrhizobium sp. TaxID=376 RepID=UPI00260E9602|nr:DUF3800 domain-containing protein [Bradyrhizobium sp.]
MGKVGGRDPNAALFDPLLSYDQSNHLLFWLIMLQAHIDDSGWDGKSPVFVLAGYVSTTERWQTFSEEWQHVLSQEKPRALATFKMKHAVQLKNRKSPFYGWSEKDRDNRLVELTKVIKRNVMHGFISVVPIEPYQRIMTGKFNLEALDRPYFLSFFGVMTALLHLTKHLYASDKIEFIFDTQDNESRCVLMKEYERFISLAPNGMKELASGFPRFQKDEDTLPLQAADMIAWHARRYYYDQYAGKDPTKEPSNVFFANLFEPEHDIFDGWTEEKIQQAAIELRKSSWNGTMRNGIAMTLPDPSSLY